MWIYDFDPVSGGAIGGCFLQGYRMVDETVLPQVTNFASDGQIGGQ